MTFKTCLRSHKKKKDIQTFSVVLSSTIYSFLGLSVRMSDFCCSLASNPVLVRKQCLAKWPRTSYTFMSVCTADRLSVAHFPTHSYKHTSGACDHHMLGLGILHWILMSLLQFSQEWGYLINQIVEDRLLPQVRGIHSYFFFFFFWQDLFHVWPNKCNSPNSKRLVTTQTLQPFIELSEIQTLSSCFVRHIWIVMTSFPFW